MAERRMFGRNLLSGDQFLDLSAEAQMLYIHLCLDSDDDGFTGRAKAIMRMVGASQENLAELISGEFLIPFETGVYAIRHWRTQNSIRKDRYTPTVHRKEMENLVILADGSYAVKQSEAGEKARCDEGTGAEVDVAVQPCISTDQNDGETEIQNSFDDLERVEPQEEMIVSTPAGTGIIKPEPLEEMDDENTAVDYSAGEMKGKPGAGHWNNIPTLEEVQEYARNRDSVSSPEKFFYYYSARNWQKGKSHIEDWRAAFRCWESREKDFQSSSRNGGMKLLPIQQYSQRDYSGMEETMDEMLARLEAG